MNHMMTGEVLARVSGWRDPIQQEREAECRRNAWRACIEDELLSNPAALKEAICNYLDGEEALQKLLAALLDPHADEATSIDKAVVRHDTARDLLDDMLKRAVDAMEAREDFRDA